MLTQKDYSYALCYSTSYEEAFVAYCNYLLALGYETASYLFIPRFMLEKQQQNPPIFSLSANYNQAYYQRYLHDRLDKDDYIIKRLSNGDSDTLYWMHDLKYGNLTPKQQQILEIMRDEYQIKNGLSIPMQNDARGIVAINISSNKNNQQFKTLNAEKYQDLFIASKLFHDHATSNHYVSRFFCKPILSSLKPTEKIVLKYILQGHSIPKIADLTYKSRGYLENIVVNIRKHIGGTDHAGKPIIPKDYLIHQCGLHAVSEQL